MEPSHIPKQKPANIEQAASSLLRASFPRIIDLPIDIDLVAEKQLLMDNLGFLAGLESHFETLAVLLHKEDGKYDIIIDPDSIKVRATFSIAHELGHVVLHPMLYSDCVTIEDSIELSKRIKRSYQRIEREANHFAGAILVPRHTIFTDTEKVYQGILSGFAGDIGWENIMSMLYSALARRYQVSVQTMQIRLNELGVTPHLSYAIANKYDFISWD